MMTDSEFKFRQRVPVLPDNSLTLIQVVLEHSLGELSEAEGALVAAEKQLLAGYLEAGPVDSVASRGAIVSRYFEYLENNKRA